MQHLGTSEGFSWLVYFRPSLVADGWKIPFALAGMLLVALPSMRRFEAGSHTLNRVLLLSLVGSWFSYTIQKEPYPYSLLPFCVLVALYAGQGMEAIWRASGMFRPLFRVALRTVGCLVPLIFGLCVDVGVVEARMARKNDFQMSILARLKTMTNPTDAIYDNSGGFVARPHINYFYFTNAFLRQSYADVFAREIPQSIEKKGVTVFLRDCRYDSLPLSLRSYLEDNFLPLDGNLWIRGRRFVRDKDGVAAGVFRVTRPGWYLVGPEGAMKEGRLTVDGRPMDAPLIYLEAGDHAVWYRGPSDEFFIAWLPRDGRRFRVNEEKKEEFAPLF